MDRTSRFSVPDVMARCAVDKPCPYLSSAASFCDMPRTNKGNSDAACHSWSNKKLLEYLSEMGPAS